MIERKLALTAVFHSSEGQPRALSQHRLAQHSELPVFTGLPVGAEQPSTNTVCSCFKH